MVMEQILAKKARTGRQLSFVLLINVFSSGASSTGYQLRKRNKAFSGLTDLNVVSSHRRWRHSHSKLPLHASKIHSGLGRRRVLHARDADVALQKPVS